MTKRKQPKHDKSPNQIRAIRDTLIEACNQHRLVWFLYYDDGYDANRMVAPLKVGELHNGEIAVEAHDIHDHQQPLKLYRIDGMDDVSIIPNPAMVFKTVPGDYKNTDKRFKTLWAAVKV